MKSKSILSALLVAVMSFTIQPAAQAVECKSATQKNCTVTQRDSRGVKTGTETRESTGKTTLRDSRGVKTGTIEPKRGTCEIIRNSRGIKVGTRGNC
jgi:hypothetical protein